MTTPKNTLTPQIAEEKLAVDLRHFAESFTLSPEFDAALVSQFQQPVKPRQPARIIRLGRIVAASAAVFVLMTLLILTIPPLRALAQDILRQIGVITISNAPTAYDVYSTQPTIPPDSTPIPGVTPQIYDMQTLSLEAAAAQTGFAVLVPHSLPARYRLTARDVWHQNGVNSVTTIYHRPQPDDSLSISQTIYDPNEPDQSRQFDVGDAAVTDVTVRGLPGLFAEHVTTWPPGAMINMLFWQEGEFTFMMQSSLLTLDEILSIADSLQ